MNRTQALERVDEILDLLAEMYVSGSCPKCGVPLYDEEDEALPAGTSASRRAIHHPPCEMGSCTAELARLTRRFAIRLEPVLMTISEADVWILTVRRAMDREGA